MNTEALFLFLILLLGLLLCSFLGGSCGREGFSGNFSGTFNLNGNGTQTSSTSSSSGASTASGNQYDNYNHYTGSSTQLSPGATFYGDNGRTATVTTNSDGSQSIQIMLPNSSTPVKFTPQQQTTTDASSSNVESYTNYGTTTTYYGPNGATATVVTGNNGQQAIKVTTSSGTYYYNTSGTQVTTTDTSTQYYGSTGYPIQQAPYTMSYQGPYGGSAGSVTGPQGNTAYYAQGPYGNTVAGTTSNDYYNTLPVGIPGNQIPPGQEDLYILKSQVVPPVCPACPTSAACPRQEPCPPCPACARCPEPAFECKKVPNYNAMNNDYLPAPVLNDFSQFGM
jgi:hypothetical protein